MVYFLPPVSAPLYFRNFSKKPITIGEWAFLAKNNPNDIVD
jgi:hypothetical protein